MLLPPRDRLSACLGFRGFTKHIDPVSLSFGSGTLTPRASRMRSRFAIGGRQQRKDARLFAIESETARRETFLSEIREQSAAPKHEAAWVNVTMTGAG